MTMTEFVHCLATMHVSLPFEIAMHGRWRDTVAHGGHTADARPFECVTEPGHTSADIRNNASHSAGFDNEWVSPAASVAVRSAFGDGPLSDRNLAKLMAAAASVSAAAANLANATRLGRARAVAAARDAATRARTPPQARISSPSNNPSRSSSSTATAATAAPPAPTTTAASAPSTTATTTTATRGLWSPPATTGCSRPTCPRSPRRPS